MSYNYITMIQKPHIDIAEEYVYWASRHQVSQETVCKVILQRWIFFHLNEDEQQWIRTLAQTICPTQAELDHINEAWKSIGRKSEPLPIKGTASEIIQWLKNLRRND